MFYHYLVKFDCQHSQIYSKYLPEMLGSRLYVCADLLTILEDTSSERISQAVKPRNDLYTG